MVFQIIGLGLTALSAYNNYRNQKKQADDINRYNQQNYQNDLAYREEVKKYNKKVKFSNNSKITYLVSNNKKIKKYLPKKTTDPVKEILSNI